MSRACPPLRRRRRAGRAAVLALAAGLTVLASAAGGSRALAASPPRPASAVTAAARPALSATPARLAALHDLPQPAAAARPGGCGLTDITCHVSSAITGWFADLARSAVSPLLELTGHSALSTPQPGAIPAARRMWSVSLAVADTCYVLLVLIGGIVVMTHETVQVSYSAKEIAPRIVLGFLGANLSMTVISHAVTIANGLSAALAGHGSAGAARSLLTTLASSADGQSAFLVLLALAGVVLALVLAGVYVMRLMAVILLAAAAPACLALYALPQTAWAARWWWRALAAALSVQVAQGLVLTAAVQVFFSPGWLPWPAGDPQRLVVTLCLLYVLIRIPFWVTRPVLSPLGHSPASRAARFAFTAAVLSRITPVLRGAAPAGGRAAAARQKKGKRP